MNRSHRLVWALLAAVAAVATGPAVRADLMTTVLPTVLPGAGGTYDYSYLVTNAATSTVGIAEFDLSAADTANLTNIVNPDGFIDAYATGFEDIEFYAVDTSPGIAPGSSGVFSFTSTVAPDVGFYQSVGYDGTTGEPFESGGNTATPTAVPEPATAAVAGLAAAAAGLGRRRRA